MCVPMSIEYDKQVIEKAAATLRREDMALEEWDY